VWISDFFAIRTKGMKVKRLKKTYVSEQHGIFPLAGFLALNKRMVTLGGRGL